MCDRLSLKESYRIGKTRWREPAGLFSKNQARRLHRFENGGLDMGEN
jgi:hypothetical protein